MLFLHLLHASCIDFSQRNLALILEVRSMLSYISHPIKKLSSRVILFLFVNADSWKSLKLALVTVFRMSIPIRDGILPIFYPCYVIISAFKYLCFYIQPLLQVNVFIFQLSMLTYIFLGVVLYIIIYTYHITHIYHIIHNVGKLSM